MVVLRARAILKEFVCLSISSLLWLLSVAKPQQPFQSPFSIVTLKLNGYHMAIVEQIVDNQAVSGFSFDRDSTFHFRNGILIKIYWNTSIIPTQISTLKVEKDTILTAP